MKTYTFKTRWGATREVKANNIDEAWDEMVEDFGDGVGDWELVS